MLEALTPSAYVIMFNNCRRLPMLCAPPQPQRVVEVPVDALSVVATPAQDLEVWVTRSCT